MENFTPVAATIGGFLIGLSAVMLLALQGRIAGISGILGGLLPPKADFGLWRWLFLLGLVIGTLVFVALGGDVSLRNINPFAFGDGTHFAVLIAGGLLVGLGTQLGSGCTSGHGVCGIGQFSVRSIVATVTFMITAGITVFIIRAGVGG